MTFRQSTMITQHCDCSYPVVTFYFLGKQVGRVPANLCRAFFHMLERRLVQSITCKYMGVVGHSARPAVNQRYQRNAAGADRPGGGVDLNCQYLFHVEHRHFETAMRLLEQYVPMNDLDSRVYA